MTNETEFKIIRTDIDKPVPTQPWKKEPHTIFTITGADNRPVAYFQADSLQVGTTPNDLLGTFSTEISDIPTTINNRAQTAANNTQKAFAL